MSVGNDVWKADATSNIYDYKLIQFRLEHLAEVRDSGDVAELIYLLRSGLLRNLGGIGDPRLFSRSYLGTKSLIEDYLNQVVTQLQYIQRNDFEVLSPQQKVEFFHDTRQSFGNTALLLEGGATFGLFHLGVVKALSEHHLLPRIISGSSVGALIAALVCVHTEQDLPCIFQPGGINLKAFAKKGIKGNITRKITRLLKYGYLMDVKVLEDCVRSNVGDLTFEEAYARSKRVLNITLVSGVSTSCSQAHLMITDSVASTRKYEVPRLLNYLTASNVHAHQVGGSVADALRRTLNSVLPAAVMGLYESVDLLAKDNYGNIAIPVTLAFQLAPPGIISKLTDF
ncbi:hypothetical protein SpCBS45565_g07347 [Spizellomyces sp. 'palustris']|nr:hypothetical protein SpCBS45565_g07347 [Spizellomyces sp. 'palustris']